MAKYPDTVPDLGIQSACYPNTVHSTLMFRSDFPPDYVDVANLRDTQLDQPRESLLDAQDDGPPVTPHSEKPLPIETAPIHHKFPPQHIIYRDPDGPRPTHEFPPQNIIYRDPDGPRPTHDFPPQNNISHQGPNGPNGPEPPRKSCSTNVPRCENKLSDDEIPQLQYPTFAHIVHTSRESVIMPRGHSEDGFSNRHINPHTIKFENIIVKQNAELRELREITQEDRRRIEHLHSDIVHRDIQIRALKHTISKVRTSNTAMATDSQIEADYKYLISQLKNWTLSHFRGCKPTHINQTLAKFGLTDPNAVASAAKLLDESTPRRFQVISMLVMLYIKARVFSAFLFGADDQEQQLLESLADSFTKTATVREVHFWRSNTLKMIVATEHHKRCVCERKKELVAEIESLLVNTVPASGNAGKRTDSLKIVVDQAVALALTLRVQRAYYLLYHQGPGNKFQEFFMELEGDVDDDSEDGDGGEGGSNSRFMDLFKGKSQRKIGLTVFPALIKKGNDEGENYDRCECLYKAKVFGG